MRPQGARRITVRRGQERGQTSNEWLDSRHTFSFGDYYDSRNMGFRSLRVINEDWIAPGRGFPMHPHRDMEILTYVLDGKVQHQDSMGNRTTIAPDELQRMSAGTGIVHSEHNASQAETLHLLQIWIVPERQGLEPSYEQRAIAQHEQADSLERVASRLGERGGIAIHQDVELYRGVLGARDKAGFDLRPGRHAWIQVTRGTVRLGDVSLGPGDGAALGEPGRLELGAEEPSEVLLFDLA